jgi:hypothetical protein
MQASSCCFTVQVQAPLPDTTPDQLHHHAHLSCHKHPAFPFVCQPVQLLFGKVAVLASSRELNIWSTASATCKAAPAPFLFATCLHRNVHCAHEKQPAHYDDWHHHGGERPVRDNQTYAKNEEVKGQQPGEINDGSCHERSSSIVPFENENADVSKIEATD